MTDTFGFGVMDDNRVAEGIKVQAEHCRRNGAPVTARIVEAQLALMDGNTFCGQRIANWPGLPLEDAMPLRLAGGFHHLLLTGDDDRLTPVYRGEITDQAAVDAIVCAVTADHDTRLLPWLDGPPQTNEAGRSASFMAGLLWLADHGLPSRWQCLEIGSSAGVNLMMDRYRYQLGDVGTGPGWSDLSINPEWRGSSPPSLKKFSVWKFQSLKGCDIAPVDLTDASQLQRLRAYVWPEQSERHARLDFAAYSAGVTKPDLIRAEAADFVEAQLSTAQKSGTTRVLMHSIVWQYLPKDQQSRIEAAMTVAGQRATPEHPLAWMMLETNRATFKHELSIKYWPGPDRWHLLAEAQAHGSWINWLADRSAESS